MKRKAIEFRDAFGNRVKCSGCGRSRGVIVTIEESDAMVGELDAPKLEGALVVRGAFVCCPNSWWCELNGQVLSLDFG